jgi:hypothetical protein
MARRNSQIVTHPQNEGLSVMRSEASVAPTAIDRADLSKLIAFFKLLQQWEREEGTNANKLQ